MSVSAIVTAFNEAPRIAKVLEVLCSYPGFDEVIVVDDGSADGTAAVAACFKVHLIKLVENQGKGRAMEVGVQSSTSDVIFFCDADIHGLSHHLIDFTLDPVVGTCSTCDFEMSIAAYHRRFTTLYGLLPPLAGVRAVKRTLWDQVPSRFKERFMIETALNHYALQGTGYSCFMFSGLGHTIKEQKYGLLRGFFANLKMVCDILYARLMLRR